MLVAREKQSILLASFSVCNESVLLHRKFGASPCLKILTLLAEHPESFH